MGLEPGVGVSTQAGEGLRRGLGGEDHVVVDAVAEVVDLHPARLRPAAIEQVGDGGDDLGALGARSYFRDFAYFTDDAYTFVPYAVFAISGNMFALQANLDFDIMTNAKKADGSPFDTGGDSTELILKYGATASLTPDFGVPFSTSFLLEMLLASSTTFENNVTGAYVTPGVRVGGRMFSFGAGVQIPFGSSEITNFANVDFLVDMLVKFGG